jgi:formylglycine-generating enzyme required for sulfatase activity
LIAIYDEFGVIAKYQLTEFDDLWSVSVIISEILTGQYPFERMSKIMSAEIRPFPPNIDPKHLGFIQKALQKNRESRFQTVKELREALQSSAQIVIEKTEDAGTIIDEEFDKNEKLRIESKKLRQQEEEQEKLEQERLQLENEEQQRLKKIELWREEAAKRIQREKEENLSKQKEDEDALKTAKEESKIKQLQEKRTARIYQIGMFSITVGIILFVIWMRSDSPNNLVNKLANQPSSSPTGNTIKNSIGMEFVKIPAGSFMMGSPTSEKDRSDDEGPQRRVTINYEFYLGKYEVTQEEYEKVMGTNPSNFKNCPRCPVEQVSWNDAKSFIQKLNAKNDGYEYRLPSEAEWEYAARGGTTTPFGIGNGNSLSSEQANFDGNYPYGNAPKGKDLQKTVNVGSYQANAFGLFDMHGNVWEWCEDIWKDNYSGLSADGSANVSVGDSSLRVLRGGSWYGDGHLLRSAVRLRNAPADRYFDYGFRLVLRPTSRP